MAHCFTISKQQGFNTRAKNVYEKICQVSLCCPLLNYHVIQLELNNWIDHSRLIDLFQNAKQLEHFGEEEEEALVETKKTKLWNLEKLTWNFPIGEEQDFAKANSENEHHESKVKWSISRLPE